MKAFEQELTTKVKDFMRKQNMTVLLEHVMDNKQLMTERPPPLPKQPVKNTIEQPTGRYYEKKHTSINREMQRHGSVKLKNYENLAGSRKSVR